MEMKELRDYIEEHKHEYYARNVHHFKNDFEVRGDVAVIFLDRKDGTRLECLIDKEDLTKVASLGVKWYALYNKDTQSYYVRSNIRLEDGTRRNVKLHRVIMNIDNPDIKVDHKDKDTLNNTKSNLRLVSDAENLQNKSTYKNSPTNVRGVSKHPRTGKFMARIQVGGKRLWLGEFNNIEEAEQVVKEARQKYMPFSQE